MCKFHQDAANAAAIDPATGTVDAIRYAVVRTAMSKFRIEQYMPALYDIGGSDPYELACEAGRRAFMASPLRDRTETGAFPADLVAKASVAVGAVVARHDLAALASKPAEFFDDAMTNFYDGYAMPGFAPQPLRLKDAAHNAESAGLHAAVVDFLAQPGMNDVMTALFEYSLVRSFNEAKQSVDPVKLAAHEKAPGSLRKTLRSCAMCARDGLGGAVVSHVGCIATPIIAGAFGLAVSGPFMAGMMMITAPIVAIGATWGFDRMRGIKSSALKLAGSAGIAVALAFAISALTGGHENHANHNGTDHSQMDHSQMNHGQMNHGQMDHGQMDHGGMDHSQHQQQVMPPAQTGGHQHAPAP